MKKTLLLSMMTSSLIMAQNNSILDGDFMLDPSIALIAGTMNVDDSDADWKAMYGLELGFNCLANDSIRQQLQLTSFKDGNLKILQANVNPQYVTNINQMLKFGFGPTAGLASIDNGTDSETLFTYGVGTSLSFNVNENIFVGAEFKYEVTEDATFGDVTNNFDNIKAFTKIGYQF